ncbi:MAG TPA: response regulator transcription factor [Clostridia bacterium]|nr:response regulator transcription factor [Clostridia bacterium]
MEKNKILIIEDEAHIIELLTFNLEKNNFEVVIAKDGEEGLKMAYTEKPDLILLDLMLPKIEGTKVCMQLKNNQKMQDTPIIMLTAKSEEMDKILGLEIGADDYVTKPFSVRELIARIKVIISRYEKTKTIEESEEIIETNGLIIDLQKREVKINDIIIQLTFKEFELLLILCQNRKKVLSRDHLLNQIWGYEYYGNTRTVDVHIRHIRSKISDAIETEYEDIETIRGVGYKMK